MGLEFFSKIYMHKFIYLRDIKTQHVCLEFSFKIYVLKFIYLRDVKTEPCIQGNFITTHKYTVRPKSPRIGKYPIYI